MTHLVGALAKQTGLFPERTRWLSPGLVFVGLH
jgi:hypothetical protein